ncbi:MAG TPA: response regulator [Candidatus Thermoplasmatota archaeon]|nr:response regulator [Candidatus Thermoplasmatota archaeon]
MSNKIMLVDDSAYMRGVLKNILRGAGYTAFVEASNGADAVGTYQKEKPDLVLMDIVMPQKNGIEALRDIKEIDAEARVVMVTAIGQEVIRNEAAEAGAEGFIVKPFEAGQVRETVERVLLHGGDTG